MNVSHVRLLAGALVCLGLVACGNDEASTVTETLPARTGAETTAPTGTTGTTTEAVKEIKPGNRGPRYFETPSGNIGCYVAASGARCDIRERDWEPPEIPKSCVKAGVDYGQGISVGKTHADFVCAGDTALGGKATLDYGEVAQRGIFRCKSEESGMTCTNIETGAGFFLSREMYRIF